MGFRSRTLTLAALALVLTGLLPAAAPASAAGADQDPGVLPPWANIGLTPAPAPAPAVTPVQVILDGKPLTLDPPATIVGGRTLVPLRGVVEAMGAAANWIQETRSVEVTKGDHYARLRIDRRLACYDRPCFAATVLDTPAMLRNDRTFVPLRFVAQTMGARVTWDAARRAVLIDTTVPPEQQTAPVAITSLLPQQMISGPVELKAAMANGTAPTPGSTVQFYLINPASGAGPLVAAGSDPAGTYTFTPDPTDTDVRLMIAAIREPGTDGVSRFSDPIPVLVAPDVRVKLTGVAAGDTLTGPTALKADLGFTATQVTYNLVDAAGAVVEKLGVAGPGENFTFYPQIGHNGTQRIQAVASDKNGTAYPSDPVTVQVAVPARASLSGIKAGDTLTSGSVTFHTLLNYPVDGIQYLLDDRHLAWGANFTWNFGPDANGTHTLKVRLIGKDGSITFLDPVSFTVKFQSRVLLTGIGPNQVVTGPVTLKTSANVKLSRVEYQLLNEKGAVAEVLGNAAPDAGFTWTPLNAHVGNRTIRAAAKDESGLTLYSDTIPFRVYLGKIYGPQPIGTKDEFKAMAIRLSGPVYRETGLSAALQVAQALLETGWGQSVPVDKYTGQLSYNLFGIKGEGPAGSVISNTWEEYNGVSYRIDDYFRAYHSVDESWRDHANLLFDRPWYAPVRAVLPNPVLGAWALRRSGYATDSQYPVKLINIMKTYDLYKLDQIEL